MGVFSLQSTAKANRKQCSRPPSAKPVFAVLDGLSLAHQARTMLSEARARPGYPAPDLTGGDAIALSVVVRLTVERWASQAGVVLVGAIFDGDAPPEPAAADARERTIHQRATAAERATEQALMRLDPAMPRASEDQARFIAKGTRAESQFVTGACKHGLAMARLVLPGGGGVLEGVPTFDSCGEADQLLAAACDAAVWGKLRSEIGVGLGDRVPTAVVSGDTDLAVIRGSVQIPLWGLPALPVDAVLTSPAAAVQYCNAGPDQPAWAPWDEEDADADENDADEENCDEAAAAAAPVAGDEAAAAAASGAGEDPATAPAAKADVAALCFDAHSLAEGLGIRSALVAQGIHHDVHEVSRRVLVEACLLAGTDQTKPLLEAAGLLMPVKMSLGMAASRGWSAPAGQALPVPVAASDDGDDEDDDDDDDEGIDEVDDADTEIPSADAEDAAEAGGKATTLGRARSGASVRAGGKSRGPLTAVQVAVWRVLATPSFRFDEVPEIKAHMADTGALELAEAAEESRGAFDCLVSSSLVLSREHLEWRWRRGLALELADAWASLERRCGPEGVALLHPLPEELVWALDCVEEAATSALITGEAEFPTGTPSVTEAIELASLRTQIGWAAAVAWSGFGDAESRTGLFERRFGPEEPDLEPMPWPDWDAQAMADAFASGGRARTSTSVGRIVAVRRGRSLDGEGSAASRGRELLPSSDAVVTTAVATRHIRGAALGMAGVCEALTGFTSTSDKPVAMLLRCLRPTEDAPVLDEAVELGPDEQRRVLLSAALLPLRVFLPEWGANHPVALGTAAGVRMPGSCPVGGWPLRIPALSRGLRSSMTMPTSLVGLSRDASSGGHDWPAEEAVSEERHAAAVAVLDAAMRGCGPATTATLLALASARAWVIGEAEARPEGFPEPEGVPDAAVCAAAITAALLLDAAGPGTPAEATRASAASAAGELLLSLRGHPVGPGLILTEPDIRALTGVRAALLALDELRCTAGLCGPDGPVATPHLWNGDLVAALLVVAQGGGGGAAGAACAAVLEGVDPLLSLALHSHLDVLLTALPGLSGDGSVTMAVDGMAGHGDMLDPCGLGVSAGAIDAALARAAALAAFQGDERGTDLEPAGRDEAVPADDGAPRVPVSEWHALPAGFPGAYGGPDAAGLPIRKFAPKIVSGVMSSPVSVLGADTGSGKSSQIPQMLLELRQWAYDNEIAGWSPERVLVTQPRRIAAQQLAKRVAFERGCEVGQEVGYSIGQESQRSASTRVTYVTTGWLVTWLVHNAEELGRSVSVICIDEVHERTLDCDVLCLVLRRLLREQWAREAALVTEGEGGRLQGRPGGWQCPRIVVMSATLESALFAGYFCPPAPLPRPVELSVGTMRYPVDISYLDELGRVAPDASRAERSTIASMSRRMGELADKLRPLALAARRGGSAAARARENLRGQFFGFLPPQNFATLAARIADKLSSLGTTTLIFAPGIAAIEDVMMALNDPSVVPPAHRACMQVVMMHSMGSEEEAAAATDPDDFDSADPGSDEGSAPAPAAIGRASAAWPGRKRRIVVATNIAETSLTLPRLSVVIDMGRGKTIRFLPRRGVTALVEAYTSKASATQRAGRAGRLAPGRVVRLYTRAFHEHCMPDHDDPELCRLPLDETILRLRALGLNDGIRDLLNDAPQPPDASTVSAALQRLYALGALDEPTDEAQLTPLGRVVSRFPESVSHAMAVVLGGSLGVVDTAASAIAAAGADRIFTSSDRRRAKTADEANLNAAASAAARDAAARGTGSDIAAAMRVAVAVADADVRGHRVRWFDQRGLREKSATRLPRQGSLLARRALTDRVSKQASRAPRGSRVVAGSSGGRTSLFSPGRGSNAVLSAMGAEAFGDADDSSVRDRATGGGRAGRRTQGSRGRDTGRSQSAFSPRASYELEEGDADVLGSVVRRNRGLPVREVPLDALRLVMCAAFGHNTLSAAPAGGEQTATGETWPQRAGELPRLPAAFVSDAGSPGPGPSAGAAPAAMRGPPRMRPTATTVAAARHGGIVAAPTGGGVRRTPGAARAAAAAAAARREGLSAEPAALTAPAAPAASGAGGGAAEAASAGASLGDRSGAGSLHARLADLSVRMVFRGVPAAASAAASAGSLLRAGLPPSVALAITAESSRPMASRPLTNAVKGGGKGGGKGGKGGGKGRGRGKDEAGARSAGKAAVASRLQSSGTSPAQMAAALVALPPGTVPDAAAAGAVRFRDVTASVSNSSGRELAASGGFGSRESLDLPLTSTDAGPSGGEGLVWGPVCAVARLRAAMASAHRWAGQGPKTSGGASRSAGGAQAAAASPVPGASEVSAKKYQRMVKAAADAKARADKAAAAAASNPAKKPQKEAQRARRTAAEAAKALAGVRGPASGAARAPAATAAGPSGAAPASSVQALQRKADLARKEASALQSKASKEPTKASRRAAAKAQSAADRAASAVKEAKTHAAAGHSAPAAAPAPASGRAYSPSASSRAVEAASHFDSLARSGVPAGATGASQSGHGRGGQSLNRPPVAITEPLSPAASVLFGLRDRCRSLAESPLAAAGEEQRGQLFTAVLTAGAYSHRNPAALGIAVGSREHGLLTGTDGAGGEASYTLHCHSPDRPTASMPHLALQKRSYTLGHSGLEADMASSSAAASDSGRSRGSSEQVRTFFFDGAEALGKGFDLLCSPAVYGPAAEERRTVLFTDSTLVGQQQTSLVVTGATMLWPDEAACALPLTVYARDRRMAARFAEHGGARTVVVVAFACDSPGQSLERNVAWSPSALRCINALRLSATTATQAVCAAADGLDLDSGGAAAVSAMGRPLLRCVAAATVLSAAASALSRKPQDGGCGPGAEAALDGLWDRVSEACADHGLEAEDHQDVCSRALETVHATMAAFLRGGALVTSRGGGARWAPLGPRGADRMVAMASSVDVLLASEVAPGPDDAFLPPLDLLVRE